jgi:uncharacterized DUF497 family protein
MKGAWFEWDPREDLENQEKHGVSFDITTDALK